MPTILSNKHTSGLDWLTTFSIFIDQQLGDRSSHGQLESRAGPTAYVEIRFKTTGWSSLKQAPVANRANNVTCVTEGSGLRYRQTNNVRGHSPHPSQPDI